MARRIAKTPAPKSNPYARSVFERVSLIMSPEEKQKLWEMANDEGISVCELVRRRIFGEDYRRQNKKAVKQ